MRIDYGRGPVAVREGTARGRACRHGHDEWIRRGAAQQWACLPCERHRAREHYYRTRPRERGAPEQVLRVAAAARRGLDELVRSGRAYAALLRLSRVLTDMQADPAVQAAIVRELEASALVEASGPSDADIEALVS